MVHYENRIREKPESKEECRRYLQSYDLDHPAVTCSAVVITHTGTGRQVGVCKRLRSLFGDPTQYLFT